MKKCLLILLIFGASCGKQTEIPGLFCTDGTLRSFRMSCGSGADAELWCLQLDANPSELFPLISASFPDSLKINNLKVNACMVETEVKEQKCTFPSQVSQSRYFNVISLKRR